MERGPAYARLMKSTSGSRIANPSPTAPNSGMTARMISATAGSSWERMGRSVRVMAFLAVSGSLLPAGPVDLLGHGALRVLAVKQLQLVTAFVGAAGFAEGHC